jgi:D,D-heptose 1,7-bisphosphate phosphatase
MQAVIMAGGKGTRVASVNGAIPKPMFPLCGKPVLLHQIQCLRQQGIINLTLTIGHLGSQIRDYFGDGSRFGVRIDYIKEKEPLGTAGALYYLKGRVTDDFLLINGDLIFDVDFGRLMDFHKGHKAMVTLLAHPNDHPYDSGIILADGDGKVSGWLTKEDKREWYHNCVNAGLHVLSPVLLESMTAPKKMDLDREILKPRIPSGQIFIYRSPEYVKDMGTPERIAQVEQDLETGLVQRKNLGQKQRAVFLDRDGTINKYVGFLCKPEEFELLDGAAEAIRRINQSGHLAIVVTNQPVIARGEVTWEGLDEIHRKMETLLGQEGAYLDDIFVCPHHPDRGFPGERLEYKMDCNCRKPRPGMLRKAAEKYNIDLAESWMIGDSQRDVVAGMAAGCQTVLLQKQLRLLDAVEDIKL